MKVAVVRVVRWDVLAVSDVIRDGLVVLVVGRNLSFAFTNLFLRRHTSVLHLHV
jgi:hypothetical protein